MKHFANGFFINSTPYPLQPRSENHRNTDPQMVTFNGKTINGKTIKCNWLGPGGNGKKTNFRKKL